MSALAQSGHPYSAQAISSFAIAPPNYHHQNTCARVEVQPNAPDNDPIVRAHARESHAASASVFAYNARRSGVARMYEQAGGAREMAHETYLLARFEPLLG
jgi:hypothetical protein